MAHTNTPIPRIYTVEEMAAILRIGRNTAYELVRCGKIHSVKVGHQIRIPQRAIEEFLNSSI